MAFEALVASVSSALTRLLLFPARSRALSGLSLNARVRAPALSPSLSSSRMPARTALKHDTQNILQHSIPTIQPRTLRRTHPKHCARAARHIARIAARKPTDSTTTSAPSAPRARRITMARAQLSIAPLAWLALSALLLLSGGAHAGAGDDALLLPLPGGTKPEGLCNGKTDAELFVSGLSGWIVHVNATTKVGVGWAVRGAAGRRGR